MDMQIEGNCYHKLILTERACKSRSRYHLQMLEGEKEVGGREQGAWRFERIPNWLASWLFGQSTTVPFVQEITLICNAFPWCVAGKSKTSVFSYEQCPWEPDNTANISGIISGKLCRTVSGREACPASDTANAAMPCPMRSSSLSVPGREWMYLLISWWLRNAPLRGGGRWRADDTGSERWAGAPGTLSVVVLWQQSIVICKDKLLWESLAFDLYITHQCFQSTIVLKLKITVLWFYLLCFSFYFGLRFHLIWG